MLNTTLAYIMMLFGLYIFIKLRLFSPKRMCELLRYALLKNKSNNGISPIAGLCTALAGSIGIGNITGVCGALITGGPGAVFWMWVSAFLSAALKYSEVYLAVKYKPRERQSVVPGIYGSPMLYMTNGAGRGMRPIAILFAVLCIAASFGIGNGVQSNAVSQTWVALLVKDASDAQTMTIYIQVITGAIIAIWIGYAMSGGAKRISKLASILVPVMGAAYLICAVIVIINHSDKLADAFSLIFYNAFGLKSVVGGTIGSAIAHAMSCGIEHGTFSNEAGMGSGSMAHAASDGRDPKKQGALGIIEVFVDTLIICTVTALLILTSVEAIPYGNTDVSYMAIVKEGFAGVFGNTISSVILGMIMPLFAVSSMLTWSYYGRVCVEYIFGQKAVKLYFAAFCIMAFIGSCIKLNVLWTVSNTLNLFMTVPNLFAIALLAKKIE